MTRDPDFSIPPETQGDASAVALSDKTLLVVSLTGFIVLATTLYFVLIRPSKCADELDDREGGSGINYDDELDHADVRTLNRAQRRARARNRMKKNRRIDPRPPGQQHNQGEGEDGAGDGDGAAAAAGAVADADQMHQLLLDADAPAAQGSDGEQDDYNHRLSRKERAKLAKAAEREERRLYEKERQVAKKKAEAAAAAERKEREKDKEAAALEEKKRRALEAEEHERADHREWIMLFAGSQNHSTTTVKDFIERARQRKIWPIGDMAGEYGVTANEAQSRLEQLISDDRLFGIVSNGIFTFIEPNEMQAIADFIKRNKGDTSLSMLSDEICRIVSRT